MDSLELIAQDLFYWRSQQLSLGGRPEDIDWLLDIAGGLPWSSLQSLYLYPSKTVVLKKSLNELTFIWKKHIRDKAPLQYLVGICPWRDFVLEVNSSVMIPRQETELLIEIALRNLDNNQLIYWADLGTGSGAVAISLAKEFSSSIGYAVDKSKDALLLASSNLKKILPYANVSFHLGSWWEPIKPYWGDLNLVIANPPYIPFDLIAGLEPEVRNYEPHLALCGGHDGLDEIKQILKGSILGLAPNGLLIIEHHHDQSDDVLALMKENGLIDLCAENDLQGIRRFAIGRNQS